MSCELVRAMTAEAIGTALVFAGCGAIMVDAKTHQLGHVGVATDQLGLRRPKEPPARQGARDPRRHRPAHVHGFLDDLNRQRA